MSKTDLKHIFKRHRDKVITGVLFLITYVPTWLWMWDRWFTRDSYYSHGILIPFVSAYLIWQRREEWKVFSPKRSKWGIRLIVPGLVIHILSSIFRVYFSSGLSMIVVLLGLCLHFFGGKITRKILFPILFLFFMVPMPLVVIANISFKLKIFAAQIAETVLNSMRIPAVREGSLIKMRHAYVMVDDVCSGLRSLISLTALGSIFAYWMKAEMGKRLLLFLSTIPIAIITNVFRVVFLSAIAEIWGPKYAVGFTHDLSGFLVFALAFVLLYIMGKILE